MLWFWDFDKVGFILELEAVEELEGLSHVVNGVSDCSFSQGSES